MTGMEITEVLGNLGDFIGAIAVFGTIVYLAIQVRQGKQSVDANTEALREQHRLAMAQAHQANAEAGERNCLLLADSPTAGASLLQLSRENKLADDPDVLFRQYMILQSIIYRWQNLDYQLNEGFLAGSSRSIFEENFSRPAAAPIVRGIQAFTLDAFTVTPEFRERLEPLIDAASTSTTPTRPTE